MGNISYLHQNSDISGEVCPVCNGRNTWDIFRCNVCGNVFCGYCAPDAVVHTEDTDSFIVTCPTCNSFTLFV